MRPNSPPPDDQRIFEHSPLLQVLDQGCAGLVGLFGIVFDIVNQVIVLVPRFVKDLHEPHAALE